MRAARLTVKLTGSEMDGGDVVLDDLKGFCSALSACLKVVERVLDVESALDYRLVGLRRGSCGMTLEPTAQTDDTHDGKRVLDLFRNTVRSLETGRRVDPRYTSHDLRVFRRLTDPLNRKVREIHFGRSKVSEQYRANIDKMLNRPSVAAGEATGLLEKVDVHDRNVFTLFPNIGEPITCMFANGLLDQVKQGLKQNVTIYGKLFYFLDSPFPGKANVTEIVVHPPDNQLPSLYDLHGSWACEVSHGA